MRTTSRTRKAAAVAAAVAALAFAGAGPAVADDTDPSASPSATPGDDGRGPTEAGTSFRTATLFLPGQHATADASSGDYLYWRVPVDAGQRATVTAKVTFPDTSARKAATTWQVDVYDGLRRRQACMYGTQREAVRPGDADVELRCTLRTVRAWAEPWSTDPLPGDYYIRLTVVQAQQDDLGLPMRAEVDVDAQDKGGAFEVGGKLAAPLVPGATTGDDAGASDDSSDDASPAAADDSAAGAARPPADEPDGGWSSGWWTDRWLWTGGGAVPAALAGIAGYRVTRPRRHHHHPQQPVPPGGGY